ncbi:hypothetical protein CQA62_06745, partial [Helicobacter cholecystus]
NVTLDTLANVNFVFNGTNPLVDGNITVSSDVTGSFSNPNGVLHLNNINFLSGVTGKLTFENSVSINDITKPGGNGVLGNQSFLIFKGESNVIQSFIIQNVVTKGKAHTFDVVFEESTQNNTIHTVKSISGKGNTSFSNTNKIVFKGSGENLIDILIEANTSNLQTPLQGKNEITFEKSGRISAPIRAIGGINSIVFKGAGENSIITGDILSLRSPYGADRISKNEVTFQNGGKISGQIQVKAGDNIINFSGNGDASIL